MERGRGEDCDSAGERRGGVGAIGARGMKVAAPSPPARAMERGRGERGRGVGAIGAWGMKVAERATEQGRGKERRAQMWHRRDRRAGIVSGFVRDGAWIRRGRRIRRREASLARSARGD